MANLQATTINGDLSASNGKVYDSGSSFTPWYKLGHCDCHSGIDGRNDCLGTGYTYLHVRTPIPADNTSSGIGWLPSMLELVGYHTYGGEHFHNHKWVLNTTGDSNDFAATQLSHQGTSAGFSSSYNVYRSASTYGGTKRVVMVMPKVTCCCTGYLWIRWSISSQYRNDYAWATQMFNSTTVGY